MIPARLRELGIRCVPMYWLVLRIEDDQYCEQLFRVDVFSGL